MKIAAEGTTTLTYFAADKAGNVETKKTLVVRIDRTAPTLSCTASPNVLWSPNHELVAVAVNVHAEDGTADAPGFTLTSVTSNEPDDAPGNGDGTTTGGIQELEVGTSDTAGLVTG